jgi:hypothetical protein
MTPPERIQRRHAIQSELDRLRQQFVGPTRTVPLPADQDIPAGQLQGTAEERQALMQQIEELERELDLLA